MNMVIVGHGPSLQGAGKGPVIDSYDAVVRLKRGYKLAQQQPEDYGTRIDYGASTEKTAHRYADLPVKEYWAYDYNEPTPERLEALREIFGDRLRMESEAHQHWLSVFRGLSGENKLDHFSTGMGAVITACAAFKPRPLVLAGFDNILGERPPDDYKNVFRPEGHKYPPHDWSAEARLLPMVADHYGVAIWPLMS